VMPKSQEKARSRDHCISKCQNTEQKKLAIEVENSFVDMDLCRLDGIRQTRKKNGYGDAGRKDKLNWSR
jgi:hypothetical protein